MAEPPILSVKGVETFYGAIQALHGVDLEVAKGEIVALIGANGAGKSTLLMTICGNPRARGRHDPARRRGHHGAADARDRAARRGPGARGPAHLPAHERVREPADGRHAGRAGAFPARPRPRVRDVPAARRAARPARRHAVGRRAADAGDRPRADEPAAAAAARRAVARPGAADRAADLRGDRPDRARGGRDRSSWSSRTPIMRFAWPTAATCWPTAGSG